MKKLNSLYFSARLQKLLAQLSSVGTTLVVAPMVRAKQSCRWRMTLL